MTEEHLRQLIALEVERGEQALAAAELLLQAKLLYDAASRAYYAAFHHARALCLAVGEEPRSHQGVGHLLALHFVRPGILPTDSSRLYSGLQGFRESSDYDAAFLLDEVGAAQALTDARLLITRMQAWLRTKGHL
jgi:uncharacterized protein (UPF0332 family)